MGTSLYDTYKASQAPAAPSTPSSAPPSLYDQYKAGADPGAKIHAEYRSGNLAKRMQRENQNDTEQAAAEEGPGTLGAFGQSLAATGANIAQGIPGMELVEAGARSLVRRQPYREALNDIRGATGKIPGPLSLAEKVAGGVPAAGLLPGGPVASGALIGGASEALNADPDESLTSRGLKTAGGAALGAVGGKVAQKVGTAITALRPGFLGGTGGADANLIARQAARAQSAKQLYTAALTEGRQNEAGPAIQQFLAADDVAPIVEKIRGGRTGAQMDTPELLDRVYKEFSDMERVAKKGLGAVDPSKPNAAITRLSDIKAAKSKLLQVMSSPDQKPPLTLDVAPEVSEVAPKTIPGKPGLFGDPTHVDVPGARIETPGMRVQTAPAEDLPAMMPSYQKAVEDYAQRSQEIDALKRGYQTLQQNSGRSKLPPVNSLGKKTPLAFEEWAKTATPQELAAARQGITGGVRDAASLDNGFTFKPLRNAVSAAAPLLRSTPAPNQAALDAMRNLGLLEAGNQITQP